MKKSKSLFEALTALKAVTQTLFKKMPVLFLVVVYLIDLGIRKFQITVDGVKETHDKLRPHKNGQLHIY